MRSSNSPIPFSVLALLASACGAVLTMPFAGALIHRFGSRVTAQTGGFILCGLLPLTVLAPSLPLLIATLFCLGVFNGQMDVSMNAHAVLIQEQFKRPILSAVHGWFSVGGFAGGGFAALAAWLNMPALAHMLIAAAILAVVLVASAPSLLPAGADAKSEGVHFAPPRGPILLLGALVFLAFLTEGALWDWAAVYMRDALRSSLALSALGFGSFSLGIAVARFFGDRWIARFGHAKVVAMGSLVAALGMIIAISIHEPVIALAGFALSGAGMANVVPIFFKAAGMVPGIPARTGLAMVTTCGYTGLLAGPAVIGFTAGSFSLSLAFCLMAGFCLLIAALGGRAALPD